MYVYTSLELTQRLAKRLVQLQTHILNPEDPGAGLQSNTMKLPSNFQRNASFAVISNENALI